MGKTKKILLSVFTFLQIFFLLSPSLVQAFAYPSPNEVAGDMEDRYHINKESVQNTMEGYNVGQNKTNTPQVKVTFDPLDPKVGEMITAKALPMFFGNSSEKNNYFTWYLKRKNCDYAKDTTDTLGAAGKDEVQDQATKLGISKDELLRQCDDDGNGDITINDWMVKAHRIIAGGGYNWQRSLGRDNYIFDIANDVPDPLKICKGTLNNPDVNSPDFCTWENKYLSDPSDPTSSYIGDGADRDNDGYFAPWGGSDRINALTEGAQTASQVFADLAAIKNILKNHCTPVLAADINPANDDTSTDPPTLVYEFVDLDGDGQVDPGIDLNGATVVTGMDTNGDGFIQASEVTTTTTQLGKKCTWGDGEMKSQIQDLFNNLKDLLGLGDGVLENIIVKAMADTPWSTLLGCAGGIINPDLGACAEQIGNLTREFVNNVMQGIYDAVAEKLREYYAALPKCYIHDFTMGENYEMQFVWGNINVPICPHLFPKTHFNKTLQLALGNDLARKCNDFSSRDKAVCSDVPADCLDALGNFHSDRKGCCYNDQQHLDIKRDGCGVDDWISSNDMPRINFQNAVDNVNLFQGLNPRFPGSAELFWHTNPDDPSTADNGNNDAMNVDGVGQDSFSWYYQPGDQLGVVVEGIGMEATKYEDGSFKVMWAYPNNNCNIPSVMKGEKEVYVKGYKVKIPTVQMCPMDLSNNADDFVSNLIKGACFSMRQCLYNNLIDPTQGGQSEKMEVSLTSSPENPINDSSVSADPKNPTAYNGDVLNLDAAVANIKDFSSLKYDWEIWGSTNSSALPEDTSSWQPIPKAAFIEDSGKNDGTLKSAVKQTSGIGLSTLKLPLNFKTAFTDLKFLKARVTVTENISGGITNEGHAEIMLPIFSTSNLIHVYKPAVSWNGEDATIDPIDPATNVICPTGRQSALCSVVKNDFIALQVDKDPKLKNISWTIDGNPLPPLDPDRCAVFGDCSATKNGGDSTNIAYFPVLKEPGDTYNIIFSADRISADGKDVEKVNITKNFLVSEPNVKITSNNTENKTLLGYFLDIANWDTATNKPVEIPDYDQNTFAAYQGRSIVLTASSVPALTANQYYHWNIDNLPAVVSPYPNQFTDPADPTAPNPSPSDQTISISIPQISGTDPSSFTVSLDPIVYTQDMATKRLLNKYFNVQWNEFYESSVNKAVTINVSSQDIGFKSGAQKILATVFTGLPDYLAFLFRIVLTASLILFTSWLILAFTPKNNEE